MWSKWYIYIGAILNWVKYCKIGKKNLLQDNNYIGTKSLGHSTPLLAPVESKGALLGAFGPLNFLVSK